MDRSFLNRNARETARLQRLAETLNDRELDTPLSAGWTIAAALVHLAFWDRRAAEIVRRLPEVKTGPVSPAEIDCLNDALLPVSLTIPPRTAALLALEAAELIDSALAKAPDTLLAEIQALGSPFDLDRSNHRRIHLDEIAAAVRANGGTPDF